MGIFEWLSAILSQILGGKKHSHERIGTQEDSTKPFETPILRFFARRGNGNRRANSSNGGALPHLQRTRHRMTLQYPDVLPIVVAVGPQCYDQRSLSSHLESARYAVRMIQQELLNLLQCPETKRPLKLAEESLIARINEAIAAGKVKNRIGETVQIRLSDGLLPEDGELIYPVVDDLPIMLRDEAIPLDQITEI